MMGELLIIALSAAIINNWCSFRNHYNGIEETL